MNLLEAAHGPATLLSKRSSQLIIAVTLTLSASKEILVLRVLSGSWSCPKVNATSELNNSNNLTLRSFKRSFTGFSSVKLFKQAPVVNVKQPVSSI